MRDRMIVKLTELAKKCNMENYDRGVHEVVGFDHEKFARAIVAECAKIAEEHDAPEIVLAMLDHFGIDL
jgi:hypothetical protein